MDILSEICPKLKIHKISFAHDIQCNHRILLKFCTEHCSYTAVLCAQFQKDALIIKNSTDKWVFCEISFLRWSMDRFWTLWLQGCFKNTYELLNLRALNFSLVNKIHIFQCMCQIFCVEFQRYPLKFHTKYRTHTLKDMILKNIELLRVLRFKISFWTPPPPPPQAPGCLYRCLPLWHCP